MTDTQTDRIAAAHVPLPRLHAVRLYLEYTQALQQSNCGRKLHYRAVLHTHLRHWVLQHRPPTPIYGFSARSPPSPHPQHFYETKHSPLLYARKVSTASLDCDVYRSASYFRVIFMETLVVMTQSVITAEL